MPADTATTFLREDAHHAYNLAAYPLLARENDTVKFSVGGKTNAVSLPGDRITSLFNTLVARGAFIPIDGELLNANTLHFLQFDDDTLSYSQRGTLRKTTITAAEKGEILQALDSHRTFAPLGNSLVNTTALKGVYFAKGGFFSRDRIVLDFAGGAITLNMDRDKASTLIDAAAKLPYFSKAGDQAINQLLLQHAEYSSGELILTSAGSWRSIGMAGTDAYRFIASLPAELGFAHLNGEAFNKTMMTGAGPTKSYFLSKPRLSVSSLGQYNNVSAKPEDVNKIFDQLAEEKNLFTVQDNWLANSNTLTYAAYGDGKFKYNNGFGEMEVEMTPRRGTALLARIAENPTFVTVDDSLINAPLISDVVYDGGRLTIAVAGRTLSATMPGDEAEKIIQSIGKALSAPMNAQASILDNARASAIEAAQAAARSAAISTQIAMMNMNNIAAMNAASAAGTADCSSPGNNCSC